MCLCLNYLKKSIVLNMDSRLSKYLKIWILDYLNMVRISEIINQNPWWKYVCMHAKYLSLSLRTSIFYVTLSLGIAQIMRRASSMLMYVPPLGSLFVPVILEISLEETAMGSSRRFLNRMKVAFVLPCMKFMYSL